MTIWNYSTSPIAWDYLHDRSFASFIRGPVGSGKSVPSLQRILELCREQTPSPDGVRRSRFAVIRNTMPELRATTAETYEHIYPTQDYGEIVWRSPAEHRLRVRSDNVDAQVIFIALDKPKDVKKLLSLEIDGAFANEIREIPRSIVMRLTERVGRYLINERSPKWRGIWGDTNPPDASHYLYDWEHRSTPAGFRFFSQPPGVLEVQRLPGGGVEITDENFPEHQGKRLDSAEVMIWYRGGYQRVRCPVEPIEAAGRTWICSPWMENLAALSRVSAGANPLGARSYYGRALSGKTLEEIRSYLQGVYTFVSDGRRVVPQYNSDAHSRERLPILDDVPVQVGMDIGGGTLQPSAIFFQRHPRGTYLVHREVVCFDLGVKRFGELVAQAAVAKFPRHAERGMFERFIGDPAGVGRDEIFEVASFDYLRSTYGWNCIPAPSQDPRMRIAAIAGACERMIDGVPGLMVNRTECPTLHRGLLGAWHFKRIQVTGEERYQDTPSKNDVSHICDATGYGLLGAGEFLHLGGRSNKGKNPTKADGAFSVF